MKETAFFWLKLFGIPVLFGLLVRLLAGIPSLEDLLGVMTFSFLAMVPSGMGALTIFLAGDRGAVLGWHHLYLPCLPILFFFLVTLGLNLEGWACWVMVLPVFLLFSIIGGLFAYYFKKRQKERQEKIFVSALLLLPLLASPFEQLIEVAPRAYKAYTFIDIDAAPAAIWPQVTRVAEIPEAEDKGWLTSFLGFPRPVKAELDFEGVGASREAIFTNGLVFHEKVSSYEHQRKMVFSIKAFPYEIPSTTMDEHVVIGGDYFDVLDGTYELETLGENRCRLHLYSHFKMSTTFNFYASIWGQWIMKDIQNNILQVIKHRSES